MYDAIQRGHVFEALEEVAVQLTALRSDLPADQGARSVATLYRNTRSEPSFTRPPSRNGRSTSRAVIQAMRSCSTWIYGHQQLPIDADPFVTELHRWDFRRRAARASETEGRDARRHGG